MTRKPVSATRNRPRGIELVVDHKPASPLRILVASHSHPEVSNGGAEIAAFPLFRELQERDDCKTWFLGCDRKLSADRAGVVLSQPYGDDEFIYCTGGFDWFK